MQADILKEDQGQNTCIFSTEFSLRVMADMQEWFIENQVRNFYSVSISGYHIAEAGANPITQLAFTLANGFTYVEAYLARGMDIDDFAPNFSFFFSNGMDPEYTVIGRVARRIWAVAMRDRYGANPRSQKLKYHVQTSGRSLHAQEMAFNDIRTTLQALCAIYDNANSLHTNAYDEAVTTPTAESVRRALAIQMIINQEWGLARNENPLQGSFAVEELTDLVEEAVLAELERLSERGGVLGAMETGYQRGRIQDESMLYETKKHDGSLPIIGVNTFRNPAGDAVPAHLELARSTEDEKQSQLRRLAEFRTAHAGDRPAVLARLQEAALAGENVFAVLMDAVRSCSLGEITDALFEVGGRYRRNVYAGGSGPSTRYVNRRPACESTTRLVIFPGATRRQRETAADAHHLRAVPPPHPRGGGGAHHPGGGGRLREARPALLRAARTRSSCCTWRPRPSGRRPCPSRSCTSTPGTTSTRSSSSGIGRSSGWGSAWWSAGSRTTSTPAGWWRTPARRPAATGCRP